MKYIANIAVHERYLGNLPKISSYEEDIILKIIASAKPELKKAELASSLDRINLLEKWIYECRKFNIPCFSYDEITT